MSDKCFFDSNIFIYSQDFRDLKKQNIARKLIAEKISDKSIVISTQVLQEFYNVCTVKLKQDKNITKQCIHNFYTNIDTVKISPEMIEHAIDISVKTQFSFWDSLILAAAISLNCKILYSEDLNSGQIVEGVKIVNPFY